MSDGNTMEVEESGGVSSATVTAASSSGQVVGSKKRFEVIFTLSLFNLPFLTQKVKKWNAVALWAWDIVVDTCAICRNHIMVYGINISITRLNGRPLLSLLTACTHCLPPQFMGRG